MPTPLKECTVYIDESGDLGIHKGTKFFVISGVIVDKDQEPAIRKTLTSINNSLNIKNIHMVALRGFYKKAFVVKEIDKENFTYISIIVDTDILKITQPSLVYNHACRFLLERVSWYLRDTKRIGGITLSSRGTSKDKELIEYIHLLFTDQYVHIAHDYFNKMKINAKPANSWDLLQIADVCATSTFYSFEKNKLGFITPCFSRKLIHHLYNHNGNIMNYGIKYYSSDMDHKKSELQAYYPCHVRT